MTNLKSRWLIDFPFHPALPRTARSFRLSGQQGVLLPWGWRAGVSELTVLPAAWAAAARHRSSSPSPAIFWHTTSRVGRNWCAARCYTSWHMPSPGSATAVAVTAVSGGITAPLWVYRMNAPPPAARISPHRARHALRAMLWYTILPARYTAPMFPDPAAKPHS